MSGGMFEYSQYRINDIVDTLKGVKHYDDVDKEEFKLAVKNTISILEIAFVLAHRMDWYLSGDDSWDSYKERIVEDFKNLNKEDNKND